MLWIWEKINPDPDSCSFCCILFHPCLTLELSHETFSVSFKQCGLLGFRVCSVKLGQYIFQSIKAHGLKIYKNVSFYNIFWGNEGYIWFMTSKTIIIQCRAIFHPLCVAAWYSPLGRVAVLYWPSRCNESCNSSSSSTLSHSTTFTQIKSSFWVVLKNFEKSK